MTALVDEFENWRARLQASHAHTVQAILEHGKLIAEFYATCAPMPKGGTTFSARMKEWLGYSQQTSSCWKRIGDRYEELTSKTSALPNSWFTVSLLAGMTETDREGLMRPDVTQQEVKAALERIALSKRPPVNTNTAQAKDPPPIQEEEKEQSSIEPNRFARFLANFLSDLARNGMQHITVGQLAAWTKANRSNKQ